MGDDLTADSAPPTPQPFDPAKYLMKVRGGADYLEVKFRLLWLRTEHPDAEVSTALATHNRSGDDRHAVFRAVVTIPGGGSATGYGLEEQSDFNDYLEKAETKALGRALAALGYGTQFCSDHEFGAAAGRVVDSPVGGSFTANSAAGADDPDAPHCADCGTVIRGSKNGKYSAQQLAGFSQQKHGRVLCYPCSQKAAAL